MLGLVSLLTDASSEMVYPVLPLFLANVLHTPVAAIGLIESLAEATASIVKVFSGWLSDRVGHRQPLIVFGYGLSNLMKPLLAIAPTWPAVLRCGWPTGSARASAPHRETRSSPTRRRRSGGVATSGCIGRSTRSALPSDRWWRGRRFRSCTGGGVPHDLPRVRDTGNSAIVVLALASANAARTREATTRAAPASAPRGAVRHFTAISAVFALGNSSDAMLILRAKDLGTATAIVPLMYFVFNLVVRGRCAGGHTLRPDRASPRAHRRLRAVRRRLRGLRTRVAGACVGPWLLFAAYGVPYALTEGMARAFVVDLVGLECRATAVGSYTFVLGLAALPSSAVAGILWDTVGHSAPFALSAALMLLAAAALAIAGKRLAPGGS